MSILQMKRHVHATRMFRAAESIWEDAVLSRDLRCGKWGMRILPTITSDEDYPTSRPKKEGYEMIIKKYIKKERIPVIAIQLNLETDGFSYNKWGGQQKCKRGDWLVYNQGETYTIDADSFAATYEKFGLYSHVKTAPVYAAEAMCDGHIDTKGRDIGVQRR